MEQRGAFLVIVRCRATSCVTWTSSLYSSILLSRFGVVTESRRLVFGDNVVLIESNAETNSH